MITRKRYANLVRFTCFVSLTKLKNVKKALVDEFWVKPMKEELEQFERIDVWMLVPIPSHTNVIGTKWIFNNKIDEFGNIVRNKARLVAQGYTQIEGVDFDETFVPIARLEYVRFLFAVACLISFKLFQMDIKSAFLNDILNEETYAEKMENGILVNQSKYAKSLVKRFGLHSAKHMRTPMSTNTKLTIDDKDSSVDPSLYRSMIGSLLYLAASRPDICFSVGVCARYQANPKELYLAAVKRIICFVSGTINDGIWYTNDTNSILGGYSDID